MSRLTFLAPMRGFDIARPQHRDVRVFCKQAFSPRQAGRDPQDNTLNVPTDVGLEPTRTVLADIRTDALTYNHRRSRVCVTLWWDLPVNNRTTVGEDQGLPSLIRDKMSRGTGFRFISYHIHYIFLILFIFF